MKASELFTFSSDLPFSDFFPPDAAPWEWVRRIAEALASFEWPAPPADLPPGVSISGPVFFGPGVKLPPYCAIAGPAYIGEGCEIRPGAYIRGGVIAGRGCVLGSSGEFKNCLLLDGVQAAHFNYVGDSVLGENAHLGAGVVLANLRLDQGIVPVDCTGGGQRSSGLQKLGAMIGDGAEVGCNAVLQPGTILGKKALVMPAMAFGGRLPAGSIARVRQAVTVISPGDRA